MPGADADLLGGKRVLVVEDESLIALYNEDLLESWGCAVIGPAGNVATALELLRTDPPDAAVLDFQLDGETSEPIAEALSRAGRPFLLTTGYERHDLGPFAAGAPMLDKPVDEDELRTALADLFSS